jgi:hypothetical protein
LNVCRFDGGNVNAATVLKASPLAGKSRLHLAIRDLR